MKRYTDTEALIKKLFPYNVDKKNYSINAKAVYDAITKAPPAHVVEVVRCQDCKHRGVRPLCDGRKPEYFCADGERKEK